MKKLSFFQQDLLTEIGSIGTGHAATALAEMMGRKITITVPTVKLVGFDRVADYVGGPDNVLACVYLEVMGDLPGTVLVMFDEVSAGKLLADLVGERPQDFLSLSPLQKSALQEIGNILAGSYLSALGDFCQQKLLVSVPNLAVDMADAVFSVPMIKLGDKTDYALLIQAMFFEDQAHTGFIVFIPDPTSARKLMDIFQVDAHG